MQKVPIGDHKTFKTLENEHENHIKSKIRTNFHNNFPCAGQKVTGENALVSDTEPPARGQTKTLGALTEESPRAQELAENIVKEKQKNINLNVGKANPGQKEMNLNQNEFQNVDLCPISFEKIKYHGLKLFQTHKIMYKLQYIKKHNFDLLTKN